MKTCGTCHQAKPLSEYSVNRARKDGLTFECKDCGKDRSRRYHEANLERERERKRQREKQWRSGNPDDAHERDRARSGQQRANARSRHERYKSQVLDHYGRVCACCGSDRRFAIDHIAGDGGSHRQQIGVRSAVAMYRWLISSGFPDGFQILCMSCNASKARNERCRLH